VAELAKRAIPTPLGGDWQAAQVIQHEPAERKTSLEEARAQLDEFMGKIVSPN